MTKCRRPASNFTARRRRLVRRAVRPNSGATADRNDALVEKREPRANQLSLPSVEDEVAGDLFMGRRLRRRYVKDPDWRPNQPAAWVDSLRDQLRRLDGMSSFDDRSAVGRPFQNLHSFGEGIQFA